MNPYAERQRSLRILGYESYDAYLRGPIWRALRAKILKGQVCIRCQKRKALCLHHTAYDLATMRGDCVETLIAACRGCHRVAERIAKQSAGDPTDRVSGATLFLLSGIVTPRKRRKGKSGAKKIAGQVFHRPTPLRKARMKWNRLSRKHVDMTPRLVR